MIFKKQIIILPVRLFSVLLVGALLFSASRALAQEADNSAHPWGVGAFYGRGLSYGISQSGDSFSIWGMRLSPPMPGTQNGYFDGTYTSGAGSAVTWQSLSAGVSLQEPVETLVLSAGIGVEAIRYTTDLLSGPKLACGGYFLGSAMTNITSSVLVRFDLTINSQPTTVDMVALGLMYLY